LTFDLRHEPVREQAPVAEPDFARWRSEDGEVVATFHRVPAGYLVRFIDRADFVIDTERQTVTCRAVPESSALAVDDLYLNQLAPMLAGHAGELVIHASANAIEGVAAAFVAPTGRGKSTLAAGMARAGFPFLTDDGLLLRPTGGGYLAHPNRPSFRLWADSGRALLSPDRHGELEEDTKTRVSGRAALPFQDQPVPLRVLYFLGPGEAAAVSFNRMAVRDALAELVNHSFFLDAEDRARMARHFETVAALAETIPAFALDYPRDYDALPGVVDAIRGHLAETEGTDT
jgi:hypothetical protein